MSTNKQTKAQETVPETVDDGIEPGAAGNNVETFGDVDGGEQQDEVSGPPLRRMFDNDRQRVIEMAREARRKAEAGETDEAQDNPAADPADDGVDEPAPSAPTQAKAEPAADADPEIELVIYGQPIKKRLSEIKAEAQKSLAADQKLAEAKALVDEVKALKDSLAQRGPADGAEHHRDDAGQRAPKSTAKADDGEHHSDDLDEATLDSIVQRIQVGDQDEGRSAVKDIVEIIRKGNTSRIDETRVQQIVQGSLAQTETKREIDGAVARFSEKYPTLASDDEYLDVTLRRVSNELRSDLRANGYSDDDLAKIADPRDLARMHAEVRRKGAQVRTYDALLDDVGKHLVTKFGLKEKPAGDQPPASQTPPQRQASTADRRVEMKRAAAAQPRAAGARATTSTNAPRPKTYAEIVAEMARSRPGARNRI